MLWTVKCQLKKALGKNMENMHTDVRVWRVSFQYSKGKCLLKPTKITDETVVLLCVLAAPWPHILLFSWSHIVIECITGKFLTGHKVQHDKNSFEPSARSVSMNLLETCDEESCRASELLRRWIIINLLFVGFYTRQRISLPYFLPLFHSGLVRNFQFAIYKNPK